MRPWMIRRLERDRRKLERERRKRCEERIAVDLPVPGGELPSNERAELDREPELLGIRGVWTTDI
jgi:hypothetical protein